MIQRFDICGSDFDFVKRDEGSIMDYDDHVAAIADLKAVIRELVEVINNVNMCCGDNQCMSCLGLQAVLLAKELALLGGEKGEGTT